MEDEPDALTDTLVYTLHIPYSLPKCMHTHTHTFIQTYILLGLRRLFKIFRKLQREEDMEVRDMSSLSFRRKLPNAIRSSMMPPGR